MNEVFQRKTAYKLWINDILSSNFIREDDESRQNYVVFNRKQVSRVNIIGTVVQIVKNDEKQFGSLTIDDSSAEIRVKVWNESVELLNNVNISDTVLIIGKIRGYNEEIYIAPEIIKKVDVLWELERRLELMNGSQDKAETSMQILDKKAEMITLITEEKIQEHAEPIRGKIINLIEKYDKEDGADIFDIMKESNLDASKFNQVVEELIKQGEIYQINPNKLKLL